MISVSERQQDLFALDYKNEFSLCHCISEDLAMRKGIAVLFREKFGGIDHLRRQNKSVGDVAIIESGSCAIYNLITKSKYWHKPTYTDLEKSLTSMKFDMQSRGVSKVAMPRIGCGLDGLSWNLVKDIISRVFADTGKEIVVCIK